MTESSASRADAVRINRLSVAEARTARAPLASILADCVDGGASISFMPPFGVGDAETWWDGVFDALDAGRIELLAARIGTEWVGSAQLALEQPPNQQHRADVRKVIVHRQARGRGVGAALMNAIENRARELGRTLLILDTATGSPADRMYRRLGWNEVGTIPGMALWPDGRPCDATIFWKTV